MTFCLGTASLDTALAREPGEATRAEVAPSVLPCQSRFLRGDENLDGHVDITDPIALLGWLFLGGNPPACEDAADADDTGHIDLTDAVFTLEYLFRGTARLAISPAGCAADPTPDPLGCASYPLCPLDVRVEVCNGIDDDCDGEVDEGFATDDDPEHCGACDTRCADLDGPRVARYECHRGRCAIAECEEGFHDRDGIAENGCESSIPRDLAPCDDGNPCTVGDMYIAGICGGTPRDCSFLDDDCNVGACNRFSDECVKRPRPAGVPCDDGDPDTVGDHCDGHGVCRGTRLR